MIENLHMDSKTKLLHHFLHNKWVDVHILGVHRDCRQNIKEFIKDINDPLYRVIGQDFFKNHVFATNEWLEAMSLPTIKYADDFDIDQFVNKLKEIPLIKKPNGVENLLQMYYHVCLNRSTHEEIQIYNGVKVIEQYLLNIDTVLIKY
ncbi:unnamed protein product [Cunninghamella echinulata]